MAGLTDDHAWAELTTNKKVQWLTKVLSTSDLTSDRPSRYQQSVEVVIQSAAGFATFLTITEYNGRVGVEAFIPPLTYDFALSAPGSIVDHMRSLGLVVLDRYQSSDPQVMDSVLPIVSVGTDAPVNPDDLVVHPVALGVRTVAFFGYWGHLSGSVGYELLLDDTDGDVTAYTLTADGGFIGSDDAALSAEDLAVYPDLDSEHEADVRRMIEPLPQIVTNAIEDGAFDHDPVLRERVTTDRNFLIEQMRQSGPGELRLKVVAPLVEELLNSIAATRPDDPEAATVINVVEAAGPNEFDEEAAIRQRDELARTSGKPKALVDDVLFTLPGAISTTGAVLGLYSGAVAGHWEGALLGILVAVISATVARARR
ncbi:MAG: hypothetical protein AAGA65_31860 [Actinomycetota bacterium]